MVKKIENKKKLTEMSREQNRVVLGGGPGGCGASHCGCGSLGDKWAQTDLDFHVYFGGGPTPQPST